MKKIFNEEDFVKKSAYLALEKKHKSTKKSLEKSYERGITRLGFKRYRMYLNYEDILKKVVDCYKNGINVIDIDGYSIYTNDIRYQTFLKGNFCVDCHVRAAFIAIEKNGYRNGEFHLNLYGLKNGREILLTRDHIIPKSKFGSEHIDNMQTMCSKCNSCKSDTVRKRDETIITPNCYNNEPVLAM